MAQIHVCRSCLDYLAPAGAELCDACNHAHAAVRGGPLHNRQLALQEDIDWTPLIGQGIPPAPPH